MATCAPMKGLLEGEAIGRRSYFFDEDGLPFDPPSIEVDLQAPDGTVTHPIPEQKATGVYLTTFDLTAAGRWVYKIAPVGSLNRIDEGYLLVGRSVL